MLEPHRQSAEQVRAQLQASGLAPPAFRAALEAVPRLERDAWVDRVLGVPALPADGPSLPRDGVPYLPASVDALLHVAGLVEPADVFIDVGSGLGRPAVLVSLLTGAACVGIEVQPQLVHAARELAARLRLPRVSFVEADAAASVDVLSRGTVFFLYCPFSGERLERLVAALEPVAHAHPIRLCCVDVVLPECAWLEQVLELPGGLEVHRSR